MRGNGKEQRIAELLRPQEQQDAHEIFRAIAHGILYIGDADLRHQTEADWSTVQDIRRSVAGEVGWSPKAANALEILQDIIGSGSHTMLGKVYAGFAAVDIIHKAGGILQKSLHCFCRPPFRRLPPNKKAFF